MSFRAPLSFLAAGEALPPPAPLSLAPARELARLLGRTGAASWLPQVERLHALCLEHRGAGCVRALEVAANDLCSLASRCLAGGVPGVLERWGGGGASPLRRLEAAEGALAHAACICAAETGAPAALAALIGSAGEGGDPLFRASLLEAACHARQLEVLRWLLDTWPGTFRAPGGVGHAFSAAYACGRLVVARALWEALGTEACREWVPTPEGRRPLPPCDLLRRWDAEAAASHREASPPASPFGSVASQQGAAGPGA